MSHIERMFLHQVISEVSSERSIQRERGFTASLDDSHFDMSLILCAKKILESFDSKDLDSWVDPVVTSILEKHTPYKKLIIAASLIIAEAERLLRKNAPKNGGCNEEVV